METVYFIICLYLLFLAVVITAAIEQYEDYKKLKKTLSNDRQKYK